MRAFVILMVCGLLAGCASVSKEECIAGDWVTIGQRDGAEGRVGDTQFARHIDACAKVAVTPDRSDWARGYAQGLVQYCTPLSGVREGQAGRPYRGVCPVATRLGFLEGYDLGRSAYDQRQVIEQIDAEIRSLRSTPTLLPSADPTQPPVQVFNDLEILHLRVMRQSELARLRQIERTIDLFRARLTAG